MKSALVIAIVAGSLAGLVCLYSLSREARSAGSIAPKPVDRWPDRAAADGVVEGARPEVPLRFEVAGTLAAVHAREDRDVSRGTLLAELHNESQKHQIALSVAEVAIARAQLERLRNGDRPEKRRAVAAVEGAKRALLQLAKVNWSHSEKLLERRSVSQEERDRDYLTMVRAQAELDEAAAERAQVEAPARAEEVAEAEGRVAAAEAKLRLAEAALAKTRLLAPSDGRVLQVYSEPGELAGPATAQPVLLLADASSRRVRAFVEELDAARVGVGQPAVVTADGLPGKEFPGKVALVAPRMGRRDLQSDAPGEYKDLYFREVVIDLDAGTELPLNLRVQARIQVAPAEGMP
jgi:multidrug resistance efflux pump